MQKYNVRGATDVTGFGLAGHALKMAKGSDVTIKISMKSVPLMNGTYRYVNDGCIPGAAFRNLDYVEGDTLFEENLDYNLRMTACDAQTSGGLLMAVRESDAAAMLEELRSSSHPEAAIIGNVEKMGVSSLVIGN